MAHVTAHRTKQRLLPDVRRVIAKPYLPGEEIVPGGDSRTGLLMRRVLEIPEEDVAGLLQTILVRFATRHPRGWFYDVIMSRQPAHTARLWLLARPSPHEAF